MGGLRRGSEVRFESPAAEAEGMSVALWSGQGSGGESWGSAGEGGCVLGPEAGQGG